MKTRLQLGGWIAALAVAATVLLRTVQWPGTADPAAATMAAVQLVAGLLAAYLLVATVLAIRVPRLAPRFVRRLVATAISGGIVLAPVAAGAATAARPASDAPVLTKVTDQPSTTTTTAAPITPTPPTTTTTTTIAAPAGSGRERPREATSIPPRTPKAADEVVVAPRTPKAADEVVVAPRTPKAADEVVVAPGDHLWGIAERTLTVRLGRAATDAEIAPYWTRLIEENRDRLATGDPDLIFAGQVFRLPS